MNFSEFANILYPYCGDGNVPAEFIKVLVDNIMEIPHTTEDKDAKLNDTYNPLSYLKPDTLNRIFNNKYPISKKNVTIIKGKLDKNRFAKYINNMPLDAQMEIAHTMNNYLPNFNTDDVGESLSEVFSKILDEICVGNSHSTKTSIETPIKNSLSEISPRVFYYDSCDNKIHIEKEVISIPKDLQPSDNFEPHEKIYIDELFAAYSDATNITPIDEDSIARLPKKYDRNFKEQRKNYIFANHIFHSVRDAFIDGDKEFDTLKNDTYDYISITLEKDYDHGYDRLISVLEKVVDSNSTSSLCSIHNLISPKIKKGICHMLVNDEVIHWVMDDE